MDICSQCVKGLICGTGEYCNPRSKVLSYKTSILDTIVCKLQVCACLNVWLWRVPHSFIMLIVYLILTGVQVKSLLLYRIMFQFITSLIFVFSHEQKKKGSFQHSSFLAGGATTAAGRLIVTEGILKVQYIHYSLKMKLLLIQQNVLFFLISPMSFLTFHGERLYGLFFF